MKVMVLRTAVESVYPGESGQAVSTKGFHPLRVSSFQPSLSLPLSLSPLSSVSFLSSLSLSPVQTLLLQRPLWSRTRPRSTPGSPG